MTDAVLFVLPGIFELAILIALIARLRRRMPDGRSVLTVLLVVLVAHAALFLNPLKSAPEIHLQWNWGGKVLSILVTLAFIGWLPSLGWRRTGFAWKQDGGAAPAALAILVLWVFDWAANVLLTSFRPKIAGLETLLYQATMPGFNEEPLYHGVALLFDRSRVCG